jgi:hypothetical protein
MRGDVVEQAAGGGAIWRVELVEEEDVETVPGHWTGSRLREPPSWFTM